MSQIKCNFVVLGETENDLVIFIEASVESRIIKEYKNKISINNIVKFLLKKSISKWMKTEEGMSLNENINLESLSEILEDKYFNKYKNLRKIIKECGFDKLRIRVVEISKEWTFQEKLEISEHQEENQIDALADLLSKGK